VHCSPGITALESQTPLPLLTSLASVFKLTVKEAARAAPPVRNKDKNSSKTALTRNAARFASGAKETDRTSAAFPALVFGDTNLFGKRLVTIAIVFFILFFLPFFINAFFESFLLPVIRSIFPTPKRPAKRNIVDCQIGFTVYLHSNFQPIKLFSSKQKPTFNLYKPSVFVFLLAWQNLSYYVFSQ
jgi:hypothetical protein